MTVLAFIFIPMSLASSIFGMNVQEINTTGHSIWIFICTSVALLALSGLGFYCRHPMKVFFDDKADPFVRDVSARLYYPALLLSGIAWRAAVGFCRLCIDRFM